MKYHRDQLLSKSAISIVLPSLLAQGEPLLETIRKIIPKILTFHTKINLMDDIRKGRTEKSLTK